MKARAATAGRSKDGEVPRGPGDRHWKLATELLEHAQRPLIEHAARYSLCREDAEDAYQRAAEKLLTRAPRMSRFQMRRWMKTVVRNEALSIRRQRQRTLNVPEDAGRGAERFGEIDWVSLLPASGPDTESQVEVRERLDRAREALQGIKRDERRALALLGKGYSYAEIQELTGWTYTKVNRCLTEGRKRFRELFASSEQGELCDSYAESISQFCDGELRDEGEIGALRAHMRACAGCRATLATFRAGPRAAAAVLPAAPFAGLLERGQELAAMIESRLPGRTGLSESALAPVLGGGGGARGGGMALIAKAAVICAGAGGGAAACFATGALPVPASTGDRGDVTAEATAPGPSEPGGDEHAVPVFEPAEPLHAGPLEADAPDNAAGDSNRNELPPVPEPTQVEAEFAPEAAGVPIATTPAPAPTATASGSSSHTGTSGDGAGASGPPPTSGSDPGSMPPVGGGGGEFGP